MQKTGAIVEDPASPLAFRRLDVKAALDFVFQANRVADWKPKTFMPHAVGIGSFNRVPSGPREQRPGFPRAGRCPRG